MDYHPAIRNTCRLLTVRAFGLEPVTARSPSNVVESVYGIDPDDMRISLLVIVEGESNFC